MDNRIIAACKAALLTNPLAPLDGLLRKKLEEERWQEALLVVRVMRMAGESSLALELLEEQLHGVGATTEVWLSAPDDAGRRLMTPHHEVAGRLALTIYLPEGETMVLSTIPVVELDRLREENNRRCRVRNVGKKTMACLFDPLYKGPISDRIRRR